MRRAANLDRNHAEVVTSLERAGMKVQSLASMGGGVPDLLVGFRGLSCVLEIKDGTLPPSARGLTEAEKNWHATWPGHAVIVESAEAAVLAVIEHAREMGRL